MIRSSLCGKKIGVSILMKLIIWHAKKSELASFYLLSKPETSRQAIYQSYEEYI